MAPFAHGYRGFVFVLTTIGAFLLSPNQSQAQINLGGIGGLNLGINGGINLGINGGLNLGGIGGLNLGGVAGNIANAAGQSPYLQRAQNNIPNPVNFFQYSQVTGVKPTFGTVTIYNQFGQQGMAQNPFQQAGIGGIGGLGGAGGVGGNQGKSNGGDDPPQGVLLHVNYANMFFPNQQQINNQNAIQPGVGGLGGLGGIGGLGYLGGAGALGGVGNLGGKFGGFNGDYGL
jgi:hypothetical protein